MKKLSSLYSLCILTPFLSFCSETFNLQKIIYENRINGTIGGQMLKKSYSINDLKNAPDSVKIDVTLYIFQEDNNQEEVIQRTFISSIWPSKIRSFDKKAIKKSINKEKATPLLKLVLKSEGLKADLARKAYMSQKENRKPVCDINKLTPIELNNLKIQHRETQRRTTGNKKILLHAIKRQFADL